MIGPDFRILASLAGDATLEMWVNLVVSLSCHLMYANLHVPRNADYSVSFAKWDYSLRYPVPSGEKGDPEPEGDYDEPQAKKNNDPFQWHVDANGQIVAHM